MRFFSTDTIVELAVGFRNTPFGVREVTAVRPSEDARFRKALLELYESANLSEVADRILEAVKLLIPGDVLAVTEVDYRSGGPHWRALPAGTRRVPDRVQDGGGVL